LYALNKKSSKTLSSKFLLLIKELRAPFFTATIVPVMLGTVLAWSTLKVFNPIYFVLTFLGALCLHAGANVINDYFDYKSGCDSINVDFVSPFSGGSRLLPEGLLKPSDVYKFAMFFFGVASLIGVFLAFERGWTILLFGVIGIVSGYFYVTHLSTWSVGEFFVGLNFGPLMVLGSYYVQVQRLSLEPFIASIPVGLLIASVLWINEIPDYDADKHVGKKTLVVRLGREKAADVYAAIMIASYVSIVLGVVVNVVPVTALISLVTLPLALKAIMIARKHSREPLKMAPANASTILIHLSTGLLLVLGFILSAILL